MSRANTAIVSFALVMITVAVPHAQQRAGSGAPVTVLPIMEDVQPRGLKAGQIWLGLPVDQVVAFRGDVATIPIKVACGPDTKAEITITVTPRPRHDQEVPRLGASGGTGPSQPAHWVNGYTPEAVPTGPDFVLNTRISYGVPLTKYLRLPVNDDSPTGVYLMEVVVESAAPRQRQVGNIKLAIHAGSHFENLPVRVERDRVLVELRDDQGNPKTANVAYLRGVRDGRELVLLLHQEDPRSAIHSANAAGVALRDYDWTLVVIKRGYRYYEAAVKF